MRRSMVCTAILATAMMTGCNESREESVDSVSNANAVTLQTIDGSGLQKIKLKLPGMT